MLFFVIFRHAGVYTAEEIALVFRDKLIRLQSLYIDQFKRLHHRLREKRRQYLHTMRRTFLTPGDASQLIPRLSEYHGLSVVFKESL